jgi:hypothetical protein
MRPVLDEDCPSPTISAFSSKSRTSILTSITFGLSSLVQALTRSDFRSASVREDVDETSEGTEENRGIVVTARLVCWGAKAVAPPTNENTLAMKDNDSRMVDVQCFVVAEGRFDFVHYRPVSMIAFLDSGLLQLTHQLKEAIRTKKAVLVARE